MKKSHTADVEWDVAGDNYEVLHQCTCGSGRVNGRFVIVSAACGKLTLC